MAAYPAGLVSVETLPQEAGERNKETDGHLDSEDHGHHLGSVSTSTQCQVPGKRVCHHAIYDL